MMLDSGALELVPPTLISVAVLVLAVATYLALNVGQREKGLPPGPPTTPLFGNALHMPLPKTKGHYAFAELAKTYGSLFSMKFFGSTIIVLSDWKYVKELLDRRGTQYSFRPKLTVADMITRGDHVLLMQYGDRYRAIRKVIHQVFMESRCDKQHYEVQEAEASQMLYEFMVSPGGHLIHPKRYSNSVAMSLVYGIRVKSSDDTYMKRLYHAMDTWQSMIATGATPPVDTFPLLNYIPEKLLGNWKTRAAKCRNLMDSLYMELLFKVKGRRVRGTISDSMMDRFLDQQQIGGFDDHQLAFIGGTVLEGASDTTSNLIVAIMYAMIRYPDVQKKAQAEIDSIVGPYRSPRWSDFARLPYINMIIKEAHRWRPLTPLGVPYRTQEADEVDGMHIPANSTILLNVWALHYDPTRWDHPEEFVPERYSDYPALAPVYAASKDHSRRDHLGYGAGRRMCPGIHLAERNLWIATAKLLWAFDFAPEGDGEDLRGLTAEMDTGHGTFNIVKDYRCRIGLRVGAGREGTILRELAEAGHVFARFDG